MGKLNMTIIFLHLFGLLKIQNAQAESRIDTVLIYEDRAEVTRIQETKCTSGIADVEYTKIPDTVDERSIRAMTKESKTEVIGVTSSMVSHEVDMEDERVQFINKKKNMEEKIEQEEMEIYNIKNQKTQLLVYKASLLQIIQEEMRYPKANTSKWKTSLDDFQNTLKQLETTQQGHETTLRKLRHELNILTQIQGNRGSTDPETSITSTVRVDCKKQTSTTVLLTYIVPGATWIPEYDFTITKNKDQETMVTLTTSAIIRQSTGEDWNQAQIILTTAKPNLGSIPPYPRVIFVDGEERNSNQKILVQGEENRSTLEEGNRNIQTSNAHSLSSEGQSYTFRLPSTDHSIVSNGQEHWVPIDEQATNGNIKKIFVPKISPFGYEIVAFKNPAPFGLLTGNVHINNQGSYMGTHAIPYVGAGAPLELAIAHTPEIRMNRSTLHDKKKTTMLGKSKIYQRAYEIEIQNQSQQIQKIEIRENIPISKHEDVVVTLGKSTSKGYDWDENQGFVTWFIEIKPQETQKLELVYEVSLPADWNM